MVQIIPVLQGQDLDGLKIAGLEALQVEGPDSVDAQGPRGLDNMHRAEDLKVEEPKTPTAKYTYKPQQNAHGCCANADYEWALPSDEYLARSSPSTGPQDATNVALSHILESELANSSCYGQPSSLFFKIPPEVRAEIYKLVVGNTFAHVENDWNHLLEYANLAKFCSRYQSRVILNQCHYDNEMEAGLYRYLIHGTEDLKNAAAPDSLAHHQGELNIVFVDRHPACLCPRKRHYQGLNLQFLRTCKRIYNEAKYIHINNMTFSFRAPTVFDTFVMNVEKIQLANIRSLHFDISSSYDMEDWGYSFEEDAISLFPSLNRLYIWLDFAGGLASRKRTKMYMETFDADVYYKKPFCMFRMCPLREVKVVLSPGCWPKDSYELPPCHMSWEDMRAWCKSLEERLLVKWDGPIDLLDA
ncbi:hypothetical protein TWF481_011677 [Arthrobotrys musiformis]|uniref:DUF7730 domain-containing protein n=1 Tax=Arthrobotrys musiformis TaxID=47236 RepID=A0AAV9W058_9PEZI